MIRRCLGAFLLIAALTGRADANPAEAERFIASLADKAVAALTDSSIVREERVRRFRRLLHDHFDVKTIGRWVLGRYWRRATVAERDEYLMLFERLIVATYVDRFSAYAGVALDVTRSVEKGGEDAIVSTRILRPSGGEPIDVDWRVRVRDRGFSIVDVMVEGISMGQTQRSEFSSVIRKNGGQVEGLLVELRKISLDE